MNENLKFLHSTLLQAVALLEHNFTQPLVNLYQTEHLASTIKQQIEFWREYEATLVKPSVAVRETDLSMWPP